MSNDLTKKSFRYRGGLKRPIDFHFRLNTDEFEFMARKSKATGEPISDVTRRRLFVDGWEKELVGLRETQRKAGFPDRLFRYPSQKR